MKRILFIVFSIQLSVICLYAAFPTHTLPIVYVNTDNGQAVEDRETQVPASIYIDSVRTDYASLGSTDAPIRGTIKGRGNWTWSGFDKKPYKIKFDEKQKVLGMPNNRHWCLMACADDYLGFLKLPAGLRLSKTIGLRWTPRIRPVELVLNGRYMGLYFLTEHVRIASHRVHIHEQAKNETHPDSITGGWLVEIDNYPSEGNITFQEGNGQNVMVSLKEPETLTGPQRQYIEEQLYALNDALYDLQSDLPQRLDIEEAAKYYLVQEIMEDCESYHGSCFLYKDRDSLGIADPWKFGPVWDFGNAYNRKSWNAEQANAFIYVNPSFEQFWIGQLAEWPEFQQAVKEQWYLFYHEQKDAVRAYIREFADAIERAAKNDAEVWRGTQNYCDNSDYSDVRDRFFRRYDWRVEWLYSQWGEGIRPETEAVDAVDAPSSDARKMVVGGRMVILHRGHLYDITGRRQL